MKKTVPIEFDLSEATWAFLQDDKNFSKEKRAVMVGEDTAEWTEVTKINNANDNIIFELSKNKIGLLYLTESSC